MYRFDNISTGILVLLIIILLFILISVYNYDSKLDDFNALDLNKDGVVTRRELQIAISNELEKKNKSPPKLRGMIKSAASGALRGCLMGFLFNGLEGALSAGLVLGIINPIVSGLEYMF